jgi:hypothetical protein
MKMKALFFSLLLLLMPGVALAQSGYVTVTATVPTYGGGQATSSFQNQSSLPQLPLLNGSTFATSGVQNMDSSGRFTMVLADNTIIQPNPSQWQIIICAKPGNVGQPCYPVTLTITCVGNGSCSNGTLDISSAFAGAPAPPLPPGSLPIAFWPGQILTSTSPGSNYALQPQVYYAQAGDTISSIESQCSSLCTYFVTKPQTITLSANHTLSSNVQLNFLNGGRWTVNGGGSTLTIPGHIEGTLTQHFAGSASVSFGFMQPIVPVEWFGAVGDWNGSAGTDNTTAIQACLNALLSGQCALQAQAYKTTATLTITRSQIGFIGTSPGFPNSALYPTPSPSEIITTSASADVLDAVGTSTSNNITANNFTNFTLARSQAPVTGAAGLKLFFSYGARISGVTSEDSGVDFYLHAVGSAGVGYFENCAALWGFNGFAETSGTLAGWQNDSLDGTPSPSLRIRNSLAVANTTLTGTTTYGLLSNGAALNDLMLDHFETASVNYGEYLQAGSISNPATDIHLINSINDTCITTCVYIQNIVFGAAEISGGWDYRLPASTPVIAIISSSHIDITNQQIYFPTGTGVGISATANSGSLRISHNDFLTGSASAISFNAVTASTITGNVMNGIVATSIVSLVNSPGNVIAANTINGTATNGISLDASSNGIAGLETNQIGAGSLGTVTNLLANAGVSPTAMWGGTQIGQNGSVYKIRQEVRMSGSPLCSAAANGSCTFTLTFPKAFPDTSWMGSCMAETSTGTGAVVNVFAGGKTTTAATATFRDFSAATNALTAAVCEGWE